MAELENNVDLTKLFDYADELAKLYKMEIQNSNSKASGELYNFTHNVTWDGATLKIVFNLPEYWYYLENGRMPTKQSEGGVLLPAIRQWIQQKGIVPRDGDVDSMAYAITRSIHKLGYFKPNHHGKHLLENAITQAQANGLVDKITKSVVDDLSKPIKVSLQDLTK